MLSTQSKIFLLSACLLASCVGASCTQIDPHVSGGFVESDVEWEDAFTHSQAWAAETTMLDVQVGVGNLEIVAGEEGLVTIEVRARATDLIAVGARTPEFAGHVSVEEVAEKLVVVDKHIGVDGWSVDVKIYVPPSEFVKLAGPLSLKAVAGVGNLDVALGEYSLASVQALTGVGDVHFAALRVADSLELTSGVGTVDVVVERCSAEHCQISSGVGDIHARFDVLDGSKLSGKSGTGSVSLSLPKDSPAQYDCGSGVGSISGASALGLTLADSFVGAKASGAVGEGGPSIRLTSGVGDVTLSSHKVR